MTTLDIPDPCSFAVPGNPTAQGSMKKSRTGHIIHSNKALPAWRATVTHAARHIAPSYPAAVGIVLVFQMLRPPTVKRALPITRSSYDLDKLTRAVFDALTDSGTIEDDSRVVDLRASKEYVTDPRQSGVLIAIRHIEG